MTCRFLPPAVRDVREAARYYEEKVPGLGFEFIAEVRLPCAGLWRTHRLGVRSTTNFGGVEPPGSLTASSTRSKAKTSSSLRSCTFTDIRTLGEGICDSVVVSPNAGAHLAFQPAGSPDFPVRWSSGRLEVAPAGRQECLPYTAPVRGKT